MSKFNQEKLEQMTNKQNEFTSTKLNYVKIAQKYEEIVIKLRENGDVVPLAFKDVEVTYDGKFEEDITLPEIDEKIQDSIDQKEQERQVMHIKHFSRSISHQTWYDFLDSEINEFIDKYPEYTEIIL